MQLLDLVGTLGGARFRAPAPDAPLYAVGGQVRLVNAATGETVWITPMAGAMPQVAGYTTHSTRLPITLDGVEGSLLPDHLDAARAAGAEGRSVAGWTAPAPFWSAAVELMARPVGPETILYASRPGGQGITSYALAADNSLRTLAVTADSADGHAWGVAQMAAATVDGRNFLLTASTTENGVSVWEMGANGGLTLRHSLNAAWSETRPSIPVEAPSALAVATLGTQTYVFLAAQGTSSVTAMVLDSRGVLTAQSQVMDTLTTRFDSVAALDALVVGDRLFVAAAGTDGGVTLFLRLPDGSLQVVGVVEDTPALSLVAVSAVRLQRVGMDLQVFVTSAQEEGVTVLRVPLSSLGAVGSATALDDVLTAPTGGAVNGLAGRDIIMDSAGSETLTGGAGEDLFILRGDGAADVIADFTPGQDRIDLSRWDFFRSAAQLDFTPTATGAVLTFWTERLELIAGRPLTLAEVLAALVEPGGQVAIDPGQPEPFTTAPVDELGAGPVTGVTPPGGLPGNDTLIGTDWQDSLVGGGGDDSLTGGGDADSLWGGEGRDTLAGGIGNDQLWGEASDDHLSGDDGADTLDGSDGNDMLLGGGGADLLAGGDGDDSLSGDDGADRLTGGLGQDTLDGGAGDDTLMGEAGHDRMSGGAGADLLDGGDGNDTLDGGTEADTLTGGIGADALHGGDGDDLLTGDAGDDLLSGGEGVDRLDGGAGADTLDGGGGDDLIQSGTGADQARGGDGNDVITGGEGDDTLRGEAGADSLTGDAGGDWLEGGDGADHLDGGEGADRIFGGADNDQIYGGGGEDNIGGGAGADTVFAGTGHDSVWGEDGNDWIEGGPGRDLIGAGPGEDTIFGGDDGDRIDAGPGNDRVYGEGGADAMWGYDGFDFMVGGDGHDAMDGGPGNDALVGEWGDDYLAGSDGDDWLDGGPGNDFLMGGNGRDQFLGGDGDDVLATDAGDDTAFGGAGQDILIGMPGNDVLYGGYGRDLVVGGFGNDAIFGEEDHDWLHGDAGADWLFGGDGNDWIYGGTGNDYLLGGASGDVFVFEHTGRGEVDRILDFQNGLDLMQINGVYGATAAARFRGLSIGSTWVDGVQAATVSWGGHVIILDRVAPQALDVNDFLWV